MADKPINLRQYRKAKARKDKAEQAEANRVLHGTPKALRDLAEARKKLGEAKIEAHKREGDDNGSTGDDDI
jgi:hypothetical protein